jgi:hypothetical protein|tara:strand:- start:2002 stop:2268 length:267 start_codon:yes stop_codon:yes gene_type:complete
MDSADRAVLDAEGKAAATEVGVGDRLSIGSITGIDLIVAASLPEEGEECGATVGRIFSVGANGHVVPWLVYLYFLIIPYPGQSYMKGF